MSQFNKQNFNQQGESSYNNFDNYENDDLVTFQHNSKTISFYYSQLTKYSQKVRDSYLFPAVKTRLLHEIHEFKEKNQISSENVVYFFQLLQQNYDIDEKSNLTYDQCSDILKISKFLEIRKLSFKINEYIKNKSNFDVDFIIQMLKREMNENGENQQIEIITDIENLLARKIDECFSNEKFADLPITIIYQVIKKCSPKQINNNKLFDLIKKSIPEFRVLFQFLDFQQLSMDRIEELCYLYSKSEKKYFGYLECNINFIEEMIQNKKKT